MKRPVKRRRGYDDGGPVDPNSMSRSIQGGIDQGTRMAQTAMSMQRMMKGDMTPKDAPQSPTASSDLGGLYARGGKIKHTSGPRIGKDDGLIPAQRGEYVIRKSAVKKLGSKVLNQVNKGHLPRKGAR